MKKIKWEIGLAAPWPVLRYCKKCGQKTEHGSSGQFRVNAQGKSLDIWLIYKCSVCESTWNAAVFSRVNPKSLNPELLERFCTNEEELARTYAMDLNFLRRNGGEVGMGEYEIKGEDVIWGEPVEVHIVCTGIANVKIGAILRKKLGLSQKQLEELVADGAVKGAEGEDLLRGKMKKEMVVIIDRHISSHF